MLSNDELEVGGYLIYNVDEDLFNSEGNESYRFNIFNVKFSKDLDLLEGGWLNNDYNNLDVLNESYGPSIKEDDSNIE
ncbi:hypothetical protein CTAM01_16693 [Colletotrichum tamarilloi]|uniref:Uncharacterized protein n=1 Tax=Colletotrichum tamarilloi TaxID=1209934 RepID=A0ABQ9QHS2_9PEZI|nr:uncharacterized protein CTAM01_16693 [Colletotrichum tamarilloi]KAK1470949.1 hypothetical protein CTAM01_16693 [Colletotrichum tamarilloi]